MVSVRKLAPAVHAGRPWALLVIALLLLTPALLHARPLPDANRADLIAPVADATLSEAGLTFAWTPAPGTSEHFLLVSEQPFDPAGWTALPSSGDVRVVRTESPVVAWSALGKSLTADTRLWWAAADRDPKSGRTTMSSVRTAFVLRRFSNQSELSPLVAVSPIGRAVPEPSTHRMVHLASGYDIDPAQGEPALPAAKRLPAAAALERQSYLVYYDEADPAETRRSILASGGQVVSYLPDHTFLVRMNAAGALSLGTPGAWVGAYQPAYKLSNRIITESTARQTVSVLLFPDADLTAALDAARSVGATVLASSDNGINKVLRLELTRAAVDALSLDSDVAWIEPFVGPHTDNASAQGVVQTGLLNNRRIWDLGLKGEGQVVMTTDSGLNTQHIAIKDPLVPVTTFGSYPTHRKLLSYGRSTNDVTIAFGDHGSFHGSHTAGTVAGNNDAYGTSTNDGMAKNAKLWFTDMSGPSLGTGLLTPPDLNDLFQPGYSGNAGGAARIASDSWGSDVAGAYTVEAQQVDQFMWNHPDFLIFYSNGNAGPSAATVGSPGSAKNIVSVGAVGNGSSSNTLAGFSSRGPCADGRTKPTIVAPGNGVVSSTTSDSTYAALSGTSMACPAAAGCATLMRQYLTEGWYPTGTKVPANAFAPSAALLKAMVVGSGNNVVTGFNAPDGNIGWGRINADSVLYFSGDTRRLLLIDQTLGLGNGQAIDYSINVTDASQPLKVALVWTDYPGSPLAAVQLVNNLDLTVSKGATTYVGNQFTGGGSVTGGPADTRNVEECVRISAPTTGIWTVHVNGTSIPAGPQAYALVIIGGLGSTAGALALDQSSYGSGNIVHLRVTDTNASGPLNVNIASPTEPAGETVVLSGSNGVFNGSIGLSPQSGTVGDHILKVSNGDQITATYVDASPGATIVAKAMVGLEPPMITNVFAQGAGLGAAVVTWTTNVSANSTLYYGTTPALGQYTTLDLLAVLSHSEVITGLTPNQLYYFDVESIDLNGNVTRDDNGGAHYRFTPGVHADVLLVYDGNSFERAARYATALAATGWSYDLWSGNLSATPQLGNSTNGLRSYRAVWWQNGIDHYPPFSDVARDSITAYLNGGGRLAVTGHDVAWANSDPASPYYTATRDAWVQSTLRTQWLADPATWSGLTGVAADPISGAYAGGLSYTAYRSGAAGDEVNSLPGAGTASYDWISGSPVPNTAGFRWDSATPQGLAGQGVWGGQNSRLATNYFEWAMIDDANEASALRSDVLQKTLVWLIGRDKPAVAVTAPNGGEVITVNSVNITWTETVPGGVGSRAIEYSLDGGASWTTLTNAAGASPYSWNLTSVPNSGLGLVRVRVTDAGTPSLSTVDASNAVFTLNRVGADLMGPVVVAGSVHSVPNPIEVTQAATLSATVSDAKSGGAAVSAAEWSYGESPAVAGQGTAMTGSFGTPAVAVSAALTTSNFALGNRRLWVRGRDALGNWGTAGSLQIVVNGTPPLGVGPQPLVYALGVGVPNPAATRSRIDFAMPAGGPVELAVYDVGGRRVRSLVSGTQSAGVHASAWDLRDETGALVRAGVYYYRLDVAGRTFTRRLVALN